LTKLLKKIKWCSFLTRMVELWKGGIDNSIIRVHQSCDAAVSRSSYTNTRRETTDVSLNVLEWTRSATVDKGNNITDAVIERPRPDDVTASQWATKTVGRWTGGDVSSLTRDSEDDQVNTTTDRNLLDHRSVHHRRTDAKRNVNR